MNYKDFVIEFDSPIEDGLFPVRITESPVGKAQGQVRLPFTLDEVGDNFTRLIKGEELTDPRWYPKQFGRELFQALFQGEILEAFKQSLVRSGKRLRIKLQVKPGGPGLEEIHRLPWECMIDPETEVPLTLQANIALVRYLPVKGAIAGLSGVYPLPSPLKVLAVTPNPENCEVSKIEVEEVERAIREGMNHQGDVTIEFLKSGTVEPLRKRLKERKVHVLHITAHGRFCSKEDKSYMLFEGETGHDVDGADLASICQAGLPDLRLVNLISCEAGKMGPAKRGNPWGGIAPAIAGSGIPAVLAMQFPITIKRAFPFSAEIYEGIAKGDPIDRAVTHARARMLTTQDRGLEWGTPVLFMSTERGELFAQNQPINLSTILETSHEDDGLDINLTANFQGQGVKDHLPNKSSDWNGKMLAELKNLPNSLNPGFPVKIRGRNRLSIWFAVGYILNKVSGYVLEAEQINQAIAEPSKKTEYWTTNLKPEPAPLKFDCEKGDNWAKNVCVSISISRDVEKRARKFFLNRGSKFQEWLAFRPLAEPDMNVINNNAMALGAAEMIAREIRKVLDSSTARTLHIFFCGPGGLALFLGRELNACRQIQLYEFYEELYKESFLLK